LVPEDEVMTVVEAAFTLVIAAAGMIKDIATTAISNNFKFVIFRLVKLG
jgi:hypothetical protein